MSAGSVWANSVADGAEESMDEALAAADAALKAGRPEDAIRLLAAAIDADPARPGPVYQALMFQLYQAGRLEEGARWGQAALTRYPDDVDLLNLQGVICRRLFRLP